ncbi:Pantothenate transporter [Wickerhamomyces ciferrii]|uniref:Pantothenate transporter n=1 Tax=Wickerhamomyces ciferrii (strain ATCC 14091 / BCRC 22168 / CBS 111 / JCM 3599 / NBRC 0793 / NRRL Y-1031 F-60-10) TaxID=1206466 RepID=K0KMI9_WICCF|nr:Pantothenate transporter [Wickerhamomyces ciferrii]CCH42589.1 Pantothenate transporter [Wickerhamomyces ciferrii]
MVMTSNKFVQWLRSLFVWYPKNYELFERKLLFKLDISILAYCCVATFAANLDSANISSAFVSGMKEDLNLYGNELNWLNIAYQMAVVTAQIPMVLLSSRARFAPYVVPSMQFAFGLLTILQSQVKNIHHLYLLRFLVGFFDGPNYVCVHYVLGKWYGTKGFRGNKAELWSRTSVFFASTSLGRIVNSYLQVAAYKNLSGVYGYKGWQWLFIIDGIITIPVAIAGFIFFPGLPESPKPWWLSTEEYTLANKRRIRYKVEKADNITFQKVKTTFTDWKIYVFSLSYISMLIAWYPTLYFSLWLKAQNKYSVAQINIYPTVQNIINAVTSFLGTTSAAVISPWKPYILLNVAGNAIFTLIMTIYNVPVPAVFFAFYIAGLIGAGSPVLFSTINRVLRHDQEQKAIVMAFTMSSAMFVYTWAPLGLFPTAEKEGDREAPRWKIGYPAALAFSLLMGILFILSDFLEARDKAKLGSTVKAEDDVVTDDEYSEEEEYRENSSLDLPVEVIEIVEDPKGKTS